MAGRATFEVELAPKLFAPLSTSDRTGTLRALVDGKMVAEAPLSPLAEVPRGNIFRRIWDTILSWFA
jgi:D-alanyl-D-alanine carboxypeptidase (penicillin-binding protein 5/6)